MSFPVGQTVTPTSTFVDAAGDPVDPDTVTLTVVDPSGISQTPAVSNPSVGTYTATVTVDEPGIWYWHWAGTTGDDTQLDQGSVCVIESVAEVAS